MSESNILPMIGFTEKKLLLLGFFFCLYSLLLKNTHITEIQGKTEGGSGSSHCVRLNK